MNDRQSEHTRPPVHMISIWFFKNKTFDPLIIFHTFFVNIFTDFSAKTAYFMMFYVILSMRYKMIMYEHMRKLRKERKLKQWQLAEYLKCSQRTFSDYENGKTRIPPDVPIELSIFYGTSVDYLLDLTDEMKPHPRSNKKRKRPWE